MSALVGAFHLGGWANGSTTRAMAATPPAVASMADMPAALAVACEPGQRAVMQTTSGSSSRLTCETDPRPVASAVRADDDMRMQDAPTPTRTGVVRVSAGDRPYARPAVITEPVEVYRPRARGGPTSSTREVAARTRSWERSAVIIGSSAIVGATAGGLVKGTKGAVLGGIVGGGAATVWDQVTRRRHDLR